jgi:hypothetical protein
MNDMDCERLLIGIGILFDFSNFKRTHVKSQRGNGAETTRHNTAVQVRSGSRFRSRPTMKYISGSYLTSNWFLLPYGQSSILKFKWFCCQGASLCRYVVGKDYLRIFYINT